MRFAAEHRTVCEVLREINDSLQGPEFKPQRALLAEAERKVKRMGAKLREYSQDFDKGWWEENQDYLEDLKRRESTIYVTGE